MMTVRKERQQQVLVSTVQHELQNSKPAMTLQKGLRIRASGDHAHNEFRNMQNRCGTGKRLCRRVAESVLVTIVQKKLRNRIGHEYAEGVAEFNDKIRSCCIGLEDTMQTLAMIVQKELWIWPLRYPERSNRGIRY